MTIEHETFSRRDVPINPRITRIRKDVSWEHVLSDHKLSMRGNPYILSFHLLLLLFVSIISFIVTFYLFRSVGVCETQ